ncbi:MAG: single-stranded DNA-binding protein [Nanoarchaeota archaeon]|nr:single-stranded DNA-binding protein [Nanoarchaeota archaeon]
MKIMLNKVHLIGNLGNDPELKEFESGQKVATFSLATIEKWKNKQSGEVETKTTWHNIVVWGKVAETVHKYLKKGNKIYIDGKI